jgi:glucose-6-phosphate dehydrogenase assembly protein OpcA
VLANLVVERLTPDAERLRPVLEEVIAQFPCRTIVVRGSDDPDRRISAEVSALCHLPEPGSPQVCSERILLHAGPNATDLVPGAVRPLLEADLPLVLWWTTDPTRHEQLFRDLGDECSRLILDLPDPGTSSAALRLGLDPAICSYSRDSVWFGLTRWRELVAQFFDLSCHHETLDRIDSVHIEALSPSPSTPPRLALWLAAWLAGQLRWKPEGNPVNQKSGTGSVLRAEFQGAHEKVTVEIVTHDLPPNLPLAPFLVGVTISGHGPEGTESFRLSRPGPGSQVVRVESNAPGYCRLPSMVRATELDPAHRIAAAVESSRIDRPFENARPIVLWLIEHLESTGQA